MSNNHESHHFAVSEEHMGLVEPMPTNPEFNSLIVPNNGVESDESPIILNNMTGLGTSLPVKRKADAGSMTSNTSSQQVQFPNKRSLHLESDIRASSDKAAPEQPNPGSPGLQAQSALSKKMVQPAKRQTTQSVSAPNSRLESSEAVRSKMRESLAAALALASQKLDSEVHSAELPPNESSLNGGHTSQEYSSILPDKDIQFSDSFFVKDDLLQGNGLSWAFDLDAQKKEGEEAQDADKAHSLRDEQAILTPEKLALNIEAELFKLYGDVNKKYKEKARSLLFNLKDRNNPDLRAKVMSGNISPESLCSMSAEELASKELSEWRMAKAEEFAQMVVLPDTEVDIRRLVKKTHKGEYQVEFERDDGIVEEVSVGNSMLTQPLQVKETKAVSPPKVSGKDEDNVAGRANLLQNQEFTSSRTMPTDGIDLMQGMTVGETKGVALPPPIVSMDEFMESLNSEPSIGNLATDAVKRKPHAVMPKVVAYSRVSDRASDSPKAVSSKKAGVLKQREGGMTLKSSGRPEEKVFPNVAEIGYMWEGILKLNASSKVDVCGLFQSGEKTTTKEWSTSLEVKGRVRLGEFERFLQDLPRSRTRAVMVMHFILKDKSSKNQLSSLSQALESYVADQRVGFIKAAPGVEIYLCPPTPKTAEMLIKHMPEQQPLQTNNSIDNGLIGVVVWRRSTSVTSSLKPHKPTSKKQPFSPPSRLKDSLKISVDTPTRPPVPVFNNVSRSKPEPEPEPEPKPEDGDGDVPPGFGHVAVKDEDDLPEFNFSGNLNPPPLPRVPPQGLHHGGKMMSQTSVDHVRELIKKYGQSETNTTNRTHLYKSFDDDDDDMPEWRPEVPHQIIHHQQLPAVHDHRPPPLQHLNPNNHHIAPVVNPQSPGGLVPPSPGGRWLQSPPQPPQGARWRPF